MEGGAGPLQPEPMLRLLAEHGVEFVIIGGLALSAHGVVRGTKDIDIVPDPSPENLRRLAAALRALNAEVMLADGFDPSELGIGPDEAGPFSFAGLDDLIAMKVAAGRPQDELDIASLYRARTEP